MLNKQMLTYAGYLVATAITVHGIVKETNWKLADENNELREIADARKEMVEYLVDMIDRTDEITVSEFDLIALKDIANRCV